MLPSQNEISNMLSDDSRMLLNEMINCICDAINAHSIKNSESRKAVTKIALYIYGYLKLDQNVNSVLSTLNLELDQPNMLPDIDMSFESENISYSDFKKILDEITKIVSKELDSDVLKNSLMHVIKQGFDEIEICEQIKKTETGSDLQKAFTIFNNGDQFWKNQFIRLNRCDETFAKSLIKSNESYRDAYKRMMTEKNHRCFLLFTKTETNDDPLIYFNNHIDDLDNGILFETEEEASEYLIESSINGSPYLLELKSNISTARNILDKGAYYELARLVKLIHGRSVSFENNKFIDHGRKVE